MMEISDEGVKILREREGCELCAYTDSVGIWTIGVGHTASAGEPTPHAGMTITQEEADAIFDEDLDAYEKCVNDCITISAKQNEFDAFVSICFNIGQGAFRDSTFIRLFNAGEITECAEAILWWDQPAEIVPRRQGEYVQFLGGYIPRIKQIN